MAIDLNAIKAKLNQLQTTGTRRNNLWRPEPGKQVVRIVPYQHDRSNPFRELYFHYDLGKKNYLSPVTHGKPDPVVEFCEKLKASGNSDEWKLGKKMEPKMRTYVPVLVRGKESEGVKFWGFGKLVYQAQDFASFLDRQYTVFGKVIEGMEFVDMIKKGDSNNNGSVSDPDKIISFKSQ